MCDHVLVPDNLDVSRDTAIRLGWYFCIKCGTKIPSQKVRNARSRRKYSHETVMSEVKRIHRRRKKTSKPLDFDPELQDEPWIDDNAQLWIVSPDGSAKKQ